jgi:hypothetical protein
VPEDERPGRDEGAGQHAEAVEPAVPDGIAQRADEGECDHEMAEGQPIGSVEHERRRGLRGLDPIPQRTQPARGVFRHRAPAPEVRAQDADAEPDLRRNGQRGGAADHQPGDEEERPGANTRTEALHRIILRHARPSR